VANILIVEDSPDNMKLFRTLLTLQGHAVTGLPSGEALHETLAGALPDLVLMDIQMPVMDGIEATRRIRKTIPATTLPIVALSANAMSSEIERATEAGMNDFLTKPLEFRRLATLVGSIEPAPRTTGAAPATGTGDDCIDLARLNEVTGGDPEFLLVLQQTFEDATASLSDRLEAALGGQDREAVRAIAHQLKGSSANLHATRAAELAGRLEQLAPAAGFDALHALAAELSRELAGVSGKLRQLAAA